MAALAYLDYQRAEEELRGRERQSQTARNLQALQRLQGQTRMRVNAQRIKKNQEKCVCMSVLMCLLYVCV